MHVTKAALAEQETYKLLDCPEYCYHLQQYEQRYLARPCSNTVPNRNMIKALRMHRWLNSSEDWARLHAAEYSMLKQRNLKKSLLKGLKYKAIGA